LPEAEADSTMLAHNYLMPTQLPEIMARLRAVRQEELLEVEETVATTAVLPVVVD